MSITYPNYFDTVGMTLAVNINLKIWIETHFIGPVESNMLCVSHNVAGVWKW